jgi:site-specific recombinase XerC
MGAAEGEAAASRLGSRATPLRVGTRQRGTRVRLDNAVTVFLAEWPAEGVSPSTVRDYRVCLEWLCAFASAHGAILLSDLTPSLVRAAAAAKMANLPAVTRAPNYKGGEASAAQLVAAARRLARWLLAEGMSVADLSSVKAPRVPERIQPRLFADEFQSLETAILHRLLNGRKRVPRVAVARDLALINLLGETGLRAQEVCGLELAHIDTERGEVLITRAKRRKERVLSIVGTDDDHDPWRVVRLIEDWLSVRQGLKRTAEHPSVWTSIKGNPLSTDQLRHVLARMCLEAGLDASRPPHAFRRYVFTEHYRQRPSALPRIAARMGWSKKSHAMVNIYQRGAEVDLAREPLPLLGGRRGGLNGPSPRARAAPIPLMDVGPDVGDKQRPGPALPLKGRQEPGRLPNPRMGRRPLA